MLQRNDIATPTKQQNKSMRVDNERGVLSVLLFSIVKLLIISNRLLIFFFVLLYTKSFCQNHFSIVSHHNESKQKHRQKSKTIQKLVGAVKGEGP